MTLHRRLHITTAKPEYALTSTSRSDPPKYFSELLSSTTLKDPEFTFDPGEERACVMNLLLPQFLRSVRFTALAEVECFVAVKVEHKGAWGCVNFKVFF